MATKTSNFLIGLFVTLGLLIVVGGIIWVGASRYFEKGDRYVTYFDESVQGLDRDSEVKYRGVKVGRVEAITIAPDNRLIAVFMNIQLKTAPPQDLVAQLQLTGITGLVFINLDRRLPGEPDLSPPVQFASECPVIPSRPSEIRTLKKGLDDVLQKVKEVDAQAISQQVQGAFREIETFFKNKELAATLANLQSTSASLKNLAGRLDKLLDDKLIKTALKDSRDTLAEARRLMTGLDQDLQALKLPAVGGKTHSVLTEMAALTDRLKQAAESLELLASRLAERPPDLFFGQPPRKRWNE